MDIARAFEEAAGAVVKDVHTPELARAAGLTDNPGFDLLSIRPTGERRAIEVKGRAGTGDVEVTRTSGPGRQSARWLLALRGLRLRDAAPRLVRVQDPFGTLLAKAKGSVLISSTEITQAASGGTLNMWEFVTSAEFWKAIATALGGAATATLILVWLAKTWVGERGRKRNVEDTYKGKRNSKNRPSLTRCWKNGRRNSPGNWRDGRQVTRKSLTKNRVRFAKLHEDRVGGDQGTCLAPRCAQKRPLGHSLTRFDGVHDDEQKLQDEARVAFNEFAVYFTNNRILFTEANCRLIEEIRKNGQGCLQRLHGIRRYP